jgi:hypothetical protein
MLESVRTERPQRLLGMENLLAVKSLPSRLFAGRPIQLDALIYDSPSLLGSHNPVEPNQMWYQVWEAVGTWRP